MAIATAALTVLLAAAPQATPSPKVDPPLPRMGVESALVEVDVMVTDKGDHPRTDLGPADFEILEDGRPQPITHFARGFNAGPAGRAPSTAGPGVAAFPDEGTPRGRHLVLAIDDYHLEAPDLATVKKAILGYIDAQIQPGDEAAVVAASGSLGPLQQFTTDRDVLRRAVARLRVQNRSFRAAVESPRITDYQAELIESGDTEALDLAVQEFLGSEPRSRQNDNAQMRAEARIRTMARQIVAQTANTTSQTLASLERLVRGLTPLRGRKVVALFSGGFFMGSDRQSSRRDLEVIADAALRAGVVLYTVDARGLVATPAIGDASIGGSYNITTNPGERERIELRAMEAGRDGMNALAADTGGLALFNRNDLDGALKQVLDDSASYYRLGYEPQASPRDGRFRKLEVRLPGHSGLRVRSASGYLAQATAAAAASGQAAPPKEGDAARLLRTALDSSFPLRGLPVDISADFMGTNEGDAVVVTAVIDAGRLEFRDAANGREAAAVDLVGLVVDEEGKVVGQFSDRVELSLTAEAKEHAIANGLTYRKTLVVRPGLLQARVAVRADSNGLLGSAAQWVQVPDRRKQALALSSILVVADGESKTTPPSATARGVVAFDAPRRDEVARTFRRGGHLNYLLVVYDRPKTGAPSPVAIEKQLLSGSTVLTKSPPALLAGDSPDGTRAEGGRLRLDGFIPGDYELRIVATDAAAKATATRSLRFTVE
jgi:VWFA-related protein